jgi:hypothetical protein
MLKLLEEPLDDYLAKSTREYMLQTFRGYTFQVKSCLDILEDMKLLEAMGKVYEQLSDRAPLTTMKGISEPSTPGFKKPSASLEKRSNLSPVRLVKETIEPVCLENQSNLSPVPLAKETVKSTSLEKPSSLSPLSVAKVESTNSAGSLEKRLSLSPVPVAKQDAISPVSVVSMEDKGWASVSTLDLEDANIRPIYNERKRLSVARTKLSPVAARGNSLACIPEGKGKLPSVLSLATGSLTSSMLGRESLFEHRPVSRRSLLSDASWIVARSQSVPEA